MRVSYSAIFNAVGRVAELLWDVLSVSDEVGPKKEEADLAHSSTGLVS